MIMRQLTLVLFLFSVPCWAQSQDSVQVRLESNTIVQLDSFIGTVRVGHKVFQASSCLSPREQEIILRTAERLRFFSFPDTIYPQRDVTISGNTAAHVLRIKVGNRDKSVVWFEPPEKSFKYYALLIDLQNLIVDIVASKPEYNALLNQ